jgi:hypothetical protein
MNEMDSAAQMPFRARDVYIELGRIEERGERLRERRRSFPSLRNLVRRVFAGFAYAAGRPAR